MHGQSGQGPLSLVFAKGSRPDAVRLADLAARAGEPSPALRVGFAVSHRPANDEGWLELLAMGLTFDCRGLAPSDPLPLPPTGQLFGLPRPPAGEAIELAPGPHLGHGNTLLPVIRVLCGLGASLAAMPGVLAVCWGPAKSWMAPDYFIRAIRAWLAGGAFPALGLASLERDDSGALSSVGLDFLIGQELRFEPDSSLSLTTATRIAVRVVHQLAEGGAIITATELTGPNGEALLAVPFNDGRQLRVMRRR